MPRPERGGGRSRQAEEAGPFFIRERRGPRVVNEIRVSLPPSAHIARNLRVTSNWISAAVDIKFRLSWRGQRPGLIETGGECKLWGRTTGEEGEGGGGGDGCKKRNERR